MSSQFTIMYLCFTAFLVASGLIMIATYSLSYPWWRDWLGRLVIIYASAEISMSAILCSAVVFRINPTWFRGTWFALQIIVGLVFCAQTAAIVRLRRSRRQRETKGPRTMSAEARMQGLIEDAVRRETEPLKQAVEALSDRLAAVEADGGAKGAAPAKRASSGRTAKAKAASEAPPTEAKAQAAEVTAVTGDGVKTERVPEQRAGKDDA